MIIYYLIKNVFVYYNFKNWAFKLIIFSFFLVCVVTATVALYYVRDRKLAHSHTHKFIWI